MRPAFSVVFLTTLCGAAQGLLLTLVIVEALARAAGVDIAAPFYVTGAALSVALGALGLLASFFHLGHPERPARDRDVAYVVAVTRMHRAAGVSRVRVRVWRGAPVRLARHVADRRGGRACKRRAVRVHRDDLRVPALPAGMGGR